MEKQIITENQVKDILEKVLMEQTSKVSRNEFSRVQFKIEELQNSLNEHILVQSAILGVLWTILLLVFQESRQISH